jgi:hypothetical protein
MTTRISKGNAATAARNKRLGAVIISPNRSCFLMYDGLILIFLLNMRICKGREPPLRAALDNMLYLFMS